MEGSEDRGTVLAERIKERQRALGRKGVDLAAAAGIARSHFSELANNTARSYPKPPLLKKLAKALKCDLAYLTGDVSDPPALTPYDMYPEIRRAIDMLVPLHESERGKLLEFIEWFACTLRENGREKRPSVPPPADSAPQDDQRIDLDGHKTR